MNDLLFIAGQNTHPGVETALYKHFNRPRIHRSRNQKPHFYASEALKCRRQVALRLDGIKAKVKDPVNINRGLAFHIGDTTHQLIQQAMLEEFPDFQAEVYLQDPDGIVSGYADGVYTLNGKTYVLEIKTVTHFAYRTARQTGHALPEHETQADLYAHILGADFIHMVYVHKAPKANENPLVEIIQPANNYAAQNELAAMRKVLSQVEHGIIPRPISGVMGEVIKNPEAVKFPCPYCPFMAICVDIGPGEVHQSELEKFGL